jgi:hypothetical protein
LSELTNFADRLLGLQSSFELWIPPQSPAV